MREAVIVSAARTPIGKAYRGAFNNTAAPTLASYSIKEAVERAGRCCFRMCSATRFTSYQYRKISWNCSWTS